MGSIVCEACRGTGNEYTPVLPVTGATRGRGRGRQRAQSAPSPHGSRPVSARDPTPAPGRGRKCSACGGSRFTEAFRHRVTKWITPYIKYGDICPTCKKTPELTHARLLGFDTTLPTGDCETCLDTGIDMAEFREKIHGE